MRRFIGVGIAFLSLLLMLTSLWFSGTDGAQKLKNSEPLPFPTPGRHDLVVLMHPGHLTYSQDENGNSTGLDRDLIEVFANELGVVVQYLVVAPEQMPHFLENGQYHIAASWLSAEAASNLIATPPLFFTHDVLAQGENGLPLTDKKQLTGKTLIVMAGSRQAQNARILQAEIPDIRLIEFSDGDLVDMLDKLDKGQADCAVIDDRFESIANQFIPSLRVTLDLTENQPVVWLLGRHPNPELQSRAVDFINRIKKDGTLERLEERYFGHVQRLKQPDIVKFLSEIERTLPRLRRFFIEAERTSGLDWRLIAALAYQESHWDPLATSRTNVRGIMMLTGDTADHLGVSNRLDIQESVLAGARYLNYLKSIQYPTVKEPDRTWLALSAYNIGPGSFNSARRLAKYQKANPDNWYEMKKILPLMARDNYAAQIQASRARGGEAVILVENIRSYYDILSRREAALPSSLFAPFVEREDENLRIKKPKN